MKNRLTQIKADALWDWDDWIKSEADEKALLAGFRPDPGRAEHVRAFFTKHLRHSKGQFAGDPFTLFDWEWDDLIRPLLGWVDENGTRRFKMAYVSVAKKNGKSALMSGLGLYGLIADKEPGAEIYSAAADRDQAGIVYNESANMVDASPALSSILTLVRSQKRIVHKPSKSFYKALSADVPTKEGLNAHYILFDELHAQKTRDLYDTLRYAGRMRRQPLFVMITTAGYDKHSICYEQYTRAKHVEEGIVEDFSFFTFIAEAPEDADVLDQEAWSAANPSFSKLFDFDTFANDAQEAKESATKENRFRRYCLNQWTEQDVRWLSMDKWDACDGAVYPDDLEGQECYAGLDLATVKDVAAFVLYFPETGAVIPSFWVPKEGARRRSAQDRVPYLQWIKDGYIEATPGDTIKYNAILKRIIELGQRFNIRELAVDRWNAEHMIQEFGDAGIDVIPFGQGYSSMSAPTKELERLVLEGNLAHGGNPVLRWMAANVTVETDAADNLKPSKKKSTEKIDGIVALIMALGRAMVDDGSGQSAYSKRGVFQICRS